MAKTQTKLKPCAYCGGKVKRIPVSKLPRATSFAGAMARAHAKTIRCVNADADWHKQLDSLLWKINESRSATIRRLMIMEYYAIRDTRKPSIAPGEQWVPDASGSEGK